MLKRILSFSGILLITFLFTNSAQAQIGQTGMNNHHPNEAVAKRYKGGLEKLNEDIQNGIDIYPRMAYKSRKQGICTIHIRLGADGKASNISIVKDIGLGCGAKAKSIVETLEFLPGYEDDYDVAVEFSLKKFKERQNK